MHEVEMSVTLQSSRLRRNMTKDYSFVRVLPVADEGQIERDLGEVDVLAKTTRVLRHFLDNPDAGNCPAQRTIALARSRFLLPQIRDKFWNTIERSLTP